MSNNTNSRDNKKIRALFSALCLCIIALGMIVYFSNTAARRGDTVNENRTLKVTETVPTAEPTTEVQHAVTVKETETAARKTEETTKKEKKEQTSFPAGESNTPYKSYYKYPLTEAVQRGYSEELSFDETMGDWRAHPAVDFTGSTGDEVTAINDGLVIDVYRDSLLGGVAVVDHGGKLVVKYCGLDSISVKKGATVDIGNKLGTLGKIPSETAQGAHLHLEATLDGKHVNPLDVMGKTE
ncbi:MAG: M23 family metallopeptidase [Eubacterium sp.]|nr:M23 family metallopeptidase [Eubacterium sp.]